MEKPHICKSRVFGYLCISPSGGGFGATKEAAYMEWKFQMGLVQMGLLKNGYLQEVYDLYRGREC